MTSAPSIGEVSFEFGQLLRRAIWRPLQWMMGIFHLLPALAAVILFLLLFNIAQFREIYLSYLEYMRVVHIVWAVAGFALISAVLYQSHYLLSTMRIDVIYSNFSNPNTESICGGCKKRPHLSGRSCRGLAWPLDFFSSRFISG